MSERLPQTPFAEAIKREAKRQGMSLRALCARTGIDPAFLSRAMRRADNKRPNLELMARIAGGLGLDPAVFPEYRAELIAERVRRSAKVRDRLYRALGED